MLVRIGPGSLSCTPADRRSPLQTDEETEAEFPWMGEEYDNRRRLLPPAIIRFTKPRRTPLSCADVQRKDEKNRRTTGMRIVMSASTITGNKAMVPGSGSSAEPPVWPNVNAAAEGPA
jgi:hypothetical protein